MSRYGPGYTYLDARGGVTLIASEYQVGIYEAPGIEHIGNGVYSLVDIIEASVVGNTSRIISQPRGGEGGGTARCPDDQKKRYE